MVFINANPRYAEKLDDPQGGDMTIGIEHNVIIDYCVSDGSRIIVSCQNLAFDPHLYPFYQKPLSALAWQIFYNLTQAAAQGSTQQVSPSTEQPASQKYASWGSDINDFLVRIWCRIWWWWQRKHSHLITAEVPSRSLQSEAPKSIATRQANLSKRYNSDKEYSDDHKSLLNIAITKRFPGHGSFNGKISGYHPVSKTNLSRIKTAAQK